ncbi:MAG: FGGY family carbohydrate kinase [Sphaerochaetaceae bacterium]
MKKYYLGIDVGTSSTKATILDEQGFIIQKAMVKNILINPAEGFFEVDPIESWWKGFLQICQEFKQFLPWVQSVCISSICGSFVPVDDCLNPTYNAILYGIDTRAVNQIKRMNISYDENELIDRLGGQFTTHSVLPKILWLKENLPNVYAQTTSFVESNNFLTAKLTGVRAWDFPSAAATRLVDSQTKSIPLDICTKFQIDSAKIPCLKWPLEKLGSITEQGANETGLTQGTTVFTGACDVNAEAMSVGSIFPGDTICVFGSTISLLHTMDSLKKVKGFISGYSLLENTYRLGAATSSGVRFLAKIDSYFDFKGYLDTKGVSPLPSKLLMQPYIDGARTPFDNPNAVGVIWGINGETTRDTFFLASREALGYEIFLLDTLIEQAGEKIEVISCSGGLSNNSSVMQVIANITGKILRCNSSVDASFGDGLISMLSQYPLDTILTLPGVKELKEKQVTIKPESDVSKLYKPLTLKYLDLYLSTVNLGLPC